MHDFQRQISYGEWQEKQRKAMLKDVGDRLAREARNARTINQRTVVMGQELYVIVDSHHSETGWMLMENTAGRRIWVQAANTTLWLAEDSTLKVSDLVIT